MISVLIGSLLLLAPADIPADRAEFAAQVERLVRQLDSTLLGQRDAAERQLLELGAGVLPVLPAIDQRTSAEVATRLARVQQKLLRAQALAAAEPTLVTLKGDDLPLSEVLATIAKQTSNPIVDHRPAFGEEQRESRVNADFNKTPFWRAIDSVLDQSDLTLYGFSGQRGAFVVGRPPGASPRAAQAYYAGMFRFESLKFVAVRDLRNPSMESLKFFMEVSWEPRLQPFAILQPLAEVRAMSSGGEPIAVAGAEAEPEALVREGISTVELEIPLTMPKRAVKTISRLGGKILVFMPGPFEDFRFSELPLAAKNVRASRVEQRKAGALVIVDHVRKNNEAWEVALRVKFEGPSAALESHRSWILENQAFFEQADGTRIEPAGMEQTLQNKEEMGINYFFDLKDGPKNLTFVYRTPIMVLELPVAYEFRDLPLP